MIGLGVAFAVIGASAAAEPIKTMSFNLRADFEFGVAVDTPNAWVATTGVHRRDLATEVIRQYGPDLLGVQEAFAHQATHLSSALPGYGRYGVGRNNGLVFGEQSAIYYRTERFERTGQGTFWLSNTPNTPSVFPGADTFRIASWVILRDRDRQDQEIYVLNSHWATGFFGTAAREHSARLIRSRVESLAGDRPVVVMGDLNAFDFQPAMQILRGDLNPDGFQLLDSFRALNHEQGPDERTNHGFLGNTAGQRIDYVLYSRDLRATAAAIDRTAFDGLYPSDHYPITTTLAYEPALPGDYNGDNVVSAADYTVWRDQLRTLGAAVRADGNEDGVVDHRDYAVWLTNFGATVVPVISVPEPNCLHAGIFGLVLAIIRGDFWRLGSFVTAP